MLMPMYAAAAAALVHLNYRADIRGRRRCGTVMARNFHHRRPLGQHWNGRRRQRRKVSRRVHHLAVHHRQHRLDPLDFLFRDAEVVFRQHHQVGKLALLNAPFLALLAGKPRASRRPQFQRHVARQAVAVVVHRHPADGTP